MSKIHIWHTVMILLSENLLNSPFIQFSKMLLNGVSHLTDEIFSFIALPVKLFAPIISTTHRKSAEIHKIFSNIS